MGQGLEVLQACYQREDRGCGHSLCCWRHALRAPGARDTASAAAGVNANRLCGAGRLPPRWRHSWSPKMAEDEGGTPRGESETSRSPKHSTTMSGYHIDWPLSRAERLHLLLGLYQHDEAPSVQTEETDLQVLSEQITHLSSLLESSRRELLGGYSMQDMQGRLPQTPPLDVSGDRETLMSGRSSLDSVCHRDVACEA
eukprot:symbB.v1.2.004560.t1/scaffold239.1/size255824/3